MQRVEGRRESSWVGERERSGSDRRGVVVDDVDVAEVPDPVERLEAVRERDGDRFEERVGDPIVASRNRILCTKRANGDCRRRISRRRDSRVARLPGRCIFAVISRGGDDDAS